MQIKFFGLEDINEKTEFVIVFHPTGVRSGLAIDIFVRKNVKKPRVIRDFQENFDYGMEECQVVEEFLKRFPEFRYLVSGDLMHIAPITLGVLYMLFKLYKNHKCVLVYAE